MLLLQGPHEEGLAESGKEKGRKNLDYYDKNIFTLSRVHNSSLFTTNPQGLRTEWEKRWFSQNCLTTTSGRLQSVPDVATCATIAQGVYHAAKEKSCMHKQSRPWVVFVFAGAEVKYKGVGNPFPESFPILLLFQVEFCPRLTDLANPALLEVADFIMDIN